MQAINAHFNSCTALQSDARTLLMRIRSVKVLYLALNSVESRFFLCFMIIVTMITGIKRQIPMTMKELTVATSSPELLMRIESRFMMLEKSMGKYYWRKNLKKKFHRKLLTHLFMILLMVPGFFSLSFWSPFRQGNAIKSTMMIARYKKVEPMFFTEFYEE